MIINCKCGLHQFEVNKNEIPKQGRKVQCGVCNEIWFQTPFGKEEITTPKKSNHFFAYLFLIILITLSFIGIMETFKDKLILKIPKLEQYYTIIEVLLINIFANLKNLISVFGIRN